MPQQAFNSALRLLPSLPSPPPHPVLLQDARVRAALAKRLQSAAQNSTEGRLHIICCSLHCPGAAAGQQLARPLSALGPPHMRPHVHCPAPHHAALRPTPPSAAHAAAAPSAGTHMLADGRLDAQRIQIVLPGLARGPAPGRDHLEHGPAGKQRAAAGVGRRSVEPLGPTWHRPPRAARGRAVRRSRCRLLAAAAAPAGWGSALRPALVAASHSTGRHGPCCSTSHPVALSARRHRLLTAPGCCSGACRALAPTSLGASGTPATRDSSGVAGGAWALGGWAIQLASMTQSCTAQGAAGELLHGIRLLQRSLTSRT